MKILHVVDKEDNYQVQMSDGLRSQIDGITILLTDDVDSFNDYDEYDVIHFLDWKSALTVDNNYVHIVNVVDKSLDDDGFMKLVDNAIRIVANTKSLVATIHQRFDGYNHQCIPVEDVKSFKNKKPAEAYEQLYLTVMHEARGKGYAIIEDSYENTMMSFGGLGRRFNFWNILKELKVNKVFIRDDKNSWYQRGMDSDHKNFSSTLNKIKSLTRDMSSKHIVFVGESAGGAAAIQFGHYAKADMVLAFNPQTFMTHELRDVHSDYRWSKFADNMLSEFDGFDLCQILREHNGKTRYFIFYSKGFDYDKAHAERMKYLPGVTLIPIDCDHHGVAGEIKKMGMLDELVREACENNNIHHLMRV